MLGTTMPHAHHGHDHAPTSHKPGRLLGTALGLTLVLLVVEILGGWWTGSLALLADAGHVLTDAAALALAWAAARIAERPADARRSFGYQRLQVIAAFVNGVTLIAVVVWISFEAIQRLLTPIAVNGSGMTVIALVGGLVNLGVFLLLHRGGGHDMNVAAATLHVLGDLLGSVAAVIGGIVIVFTGWTPIDPLLSVLVSTLIVRSAWTLIRRSAHILMEGAPDWLDLSELRHRLHTDVPAIHEIHHVHCWSVGPQETLLTMHALVGQGTDHMHVLREAKAALVKHYGITHATIQIEAEDCPDRGCETQRLLDDHAHAHEHHH
jgi:cobalt-zinc-cadmium efflux system protein